MQIGMINYNNINVYNNIRKKDYDRVQVGRKCADKRPR